MTILVTGSNGLLGQKLTQRLQADPDVQLIATARKPSVVPIDQSEFFLLDISRKEEVDTLFAKVHPDVVINTAAMTNVDQCHQDREGCWKVNVDAVKNLVTACEQNKIHFIHLSTDFVFDGSHGPLDENEKTGPVNFYGESKVAAEEIVQRCQTEWSIIRTVLVYGITHDMSRSNIVLWVKNSLEQGKSINVVNDQWRTPTLAEDLATGCYLVAKKKATGIFHISGKDFYSPYEIALKAAEFFHLDSGLIKPIDSTSLNQEARRPARTGFIIEKARRELGYEPRSFVEGIEVLVEQVRKMHSPQRRKGAE
jgi:dTDP-4-dehydrorhamnose reductase